MRQWLVSCCLHFFQVFCQCLHCNDCCILMLLLKVCETLSDPSVIVHKRTWQPGSHSPLSCSKGIQTHGLANTLWPKQLQD